MIFMMREGVKERERERERQGGRGRERGRESFYTQYKKHCIISPALLDAYHVLGARQCVLVWAVTS